MEHDENLVAQDEEIAYDANNPEHVAQRKTDQGRRNKRLLNTAALILSQPNGRELMWEILSWCGVFNQEFDDSAARMGFWAGMRNTGIRLQALLMKADMKMFMRMWEENGNG